MLYRAGLVTDLRGNRAQVEFDPGVACRGCQSGYGCGLGPLLALFRRSGNSIWVELDGGHDRRVELGDPVRIGMRASDLMKISGLAYVLPVIGMLTGAWSLATLLPQFGDWSAVAGATLGIGAGWMGIATFSRRTPSILIA